MRPHDDAPDLDEELSQLVADQELVEDEAAHAHEEFNSHMLEIRRSDGTEVVTLSGLASGEKWSVYLKPGGKIQNAHLGAKVRPLVWVNARDDYEISRDRDGTYFITID
ncbi:hypothetical protein BHQ21_26220 [Mycobacterium sherrisii]|uniref:Uncharacterized protein n=1 Tax=Mycobacterium sherrisii TaxID=243061 RepID=A0A1E3S697_9MYCO|nr:hypothetical protein [Mycobacterium sherrisii]ODQ97668.1 hypothetical protein BHQ21_26220 [Mycobacterium sherrisii]